jgi:hypothetical protein
MPVLRRPVEPAALNGHGASVATCLLSGQQRTSFARSVSPFDPQRTSNRLDLGLKFGYARAETTGGGMKRREFIAGIGAAAVWPVAARAQQVPVVGFLSSRSPDEAMGRTNAFRRGLEEMGFVEGRNLAVEYRWAKGDYN